MDAFETATPDRAADNPLGSASGKKAAADTAAVAAAINPASVPVSVCYNKLRSTPQQVVAIAAQECGSGPAPLLIQQRLDIRACPLLTPVRATFTCRR